MLVLSVVMGSVGLFGKIEADKVGVKGEGEASVTAGGSFSGTISVGKGAHLETDNPVEAGTFVRIDFNSEFQAGEESELPEAVSNIVPASGFVSDVEFGAKYDITWNSKGQKKGIGFNLDFGLQPSFLKGGGFAQASGFFGAQVSDQHFPGTCKCLIRLFLYK